MHAKTIRRIKQLCCLDLDGKMLLPTLLRELQKAIPSHSGTFLWTDKNYNIVDAYDLSPDALRYAGLYFSEFVNKRDLETQPSLGEWLRVGSGVTTTNRFTYGNYYQSAFYHEFLQPLNYHHSIIGGVKDHGRPMGILLLHRAQSERQFTPKEERIFSDLIPYFAHAVKKSTDAKPLFIDSRNQGVLIFDQQGKLQHLSPEGRRLLFLATHPKIGTDHVDVEVSQVAIPQELVRLCQKLAGLFNNGGRSGNPPVWRHNNRWGKFVFRGQWLEFADGSDNGHIAVTVQQQKPLLLIVLDRSEEFGLTPKQAEICQLMVAGHSYESIAERTNVTRYTVIDHVRRIYERLAVKNRSELITKLMAD